jgi:hypothetical protein
MLNNKYRDVWQRFVNSNFEKCNDRVLQPNQNSLTNAQFQVYEDFEKLGKSFKDGEDVEIGGSISDKQSFLAPLNQNLTSDLDRLIWFNPYQARGQGNSIRGAKKGIIAIHQGIGQHKRFRKE